jgi:hypothetical protein
VREKFVQPYFIELASILVVWGGSVWALVLLIDYWYIATYHRLQVVLESEWTSDAHQTIQF